MKIQVKPFSVNEAWKGKRYRSDNYKAFQREMMHLLPPLKITFKNSLKVNLVFGFSSKAADIDNPIKPLLDILQKKYGFNDNQIYQMNVEKQITKKGEEFIELSIQEI
jgi:Holliday junction resolvase RusA-like endonuclease